MINLPVSWCIPSGMDRRCKARGKVPEGFLADRWPPCGNPFLLNMPRVLFQHVLMSLLPQSWMPESDLATCI